VSRRRLFRAPDQRTVSLDDVVRNGHIDWDDRVRRATASETSWKRVSLSSLAVTGLAIAGLVYQAAIQPGPVIVHVVHDSIGGVITVTANSVDQNEPNQLELKAAVEGWVTNCRAIYVDINAMRRGLTDCASLIEKGSAADLAMAKFYNTPHKEEPFVRAATETVMPDHVVAIPPTSSEIGPQHMQTWAVTWTERVTSRDGSYETAKPWAANVTFVLKPPETVTDAQRNPDGIHIVSWTWTEK
jgi:type IV secretory pathway TrbF-like protein